MSSHVPHLPERLDKPPEKPPPSFDSIIWETSDEQEALGCSLTLSSIGIEHHCLSTPTHMLLKVANNDASEARRQLEAFLDENHNWPPRPHRGSTDFAPLFQPPTLLLVGSLILLYTVSGPWALHSPWFTNGAGDADAILIHHEYYRLLTALCLHADPVHLLGNCLFGGFLYHFLCKLLGNGLALSSLLVTATVANYLNVILHGTSHLFVGFSTAVFATIGMLAMISRRQHPNYRAHTLLPFMAGASLLAMIGSSGERTDLGAHLFGLCCGLLWGWYLDRPRLRRLRRSLPFQGLLFSLSLAAIFIAWKIAFS